MVPKSNRNGREGAKPAIGSVMKPEDSHNPGENPGRTVPMRVQRHGGALNSGGRNPGSGRPPSVVRKRCRGSFLERVVILEMIADTDDVLVRDRIRAIDVLGKYGLMTGRADVEEVRTMLSQTIAKIEELCDPRTSELLLKAIEPIWDD